MSDLFKNVIIFGANGDIGSAFVRALLSCSSRLTLVARDPKKIKKEFLSNKKTEFLQYSFPGDNLIFNDNLIAYNEKFDLCINAMGTYTETENILDKEHFQQLLNSNFVILQDILNLICPFICNNGKFINISSIASHTDRIDEFAYSSSKSLVDKLMSSLRYFNNFENIQTLNVRAGAVKSRMTYDRSKRDLFIDPDELANICLKIICSGSSLTVPSIDVYRRN